MARPHLHKAITWPKYEAAVLAVFEEGLRRLALRATLPRSEQPINFELLAICLDVHVEFQKNKTTMPFVIEMDSTNQPVADDVVRSKRLNKRPDFACAMFNQQATEGKASQVRYSLECKRLGTPEPQWVLNENYSEHGQMRFVQEDHGYAKGCESAAMIGYAQSMDPDALLTEVNGFATTRKLPSLKKAAAGWVAKGVSRLEQDPVLRDFDTNPIRLQHLWVDLRHCQFTATPPLPSPALAPLASVPAKKATKATKKKSK